MNAQSPKAARRKRKAPPRRGVPAIVEARERKPVAFGWGANLSAREREGLKERIALFSGILLAVVIVGLLGWGLFVDNVWNPMQVSAENNKAVAQVGDTVIRMGDFKRYEAFQNTQFNDNVQTLQQELPTYQANPKKNAAIIAQIQQRISVYTQALNNLPQTTLDDMINEQIVLKEAHTVGVVATPSRVKKIMTDLEHQFGGPRSLQRFIDGSGLTRQEIQNLQVYDWMRTQLQTVLAKKVPTTQLEVRASHILIPTKKPKLAEQVLALARKPGANFAALARKYSTDTVSAKQGGDLGYFTKSKMVAPFANAAFAMKVGEIRLVLSQFGWHIIKVTGRKKMALSPQDYQQQQSGALDTWLQKESAILHVQRYAAPQSLPNLATPVATAQTIPQVVQPNSPPVPKPVVPGRTTKPTHPVTKPVHPTKKP